jgi:hypothetical protein
MLGTWGSIHTGSYLLTLPSQDYPSCFSSHNVHLLDVCVFISKVMNQPRSC